MTTDEADLRALTSSPATRLPDDAQSLAVALREELRLAEVRYCHWKSNDMLLKSATGENDLDLLVHRHDALRYIE